MRMRTAVAAIVAVVGLLCLGGYVAFRALSPQIPLNLPAPASCVARANAAPPTGASASKVDVNLDPEQMANAATIAAVGLRRGLPVRAIQVALATALQESKLHNLAGGDRDSVGLFQQRPSQGWGPAEKIADPRYAANAFYDALLKVKGWQTMRVTDAAQAVQRSAAPSAYDRWVDESDVLSHALAGDSAGAVACTLRTLQPDQRGAAAANALASGLQLDWGKVDAARSDDVVGITVTARDGRAGWQYAHWLVAHAAEQGVKRVRYGDLEWTGKGGEWAKVARDGGAGGEQVLAEVYTDP